MFYGFSDAFTTIGLVVISFCVKARGTPAADDILNQSLVRMYNNHDEH